MVLHEAVKKGDIEAAELLIANGTDVNPIYDDFGQTALSFAAISFRSEGIEFL